jgi:hypothetical protein
MASDSTYETDQERVNFAKFWLEDNHFLFSDISSEDPEVCVFLHYLMLTQFYNLGMDRNVAVYVCVADICCTSQLYPRLGGSSSTQQ